MDFTAASTLRDIHGILKRQGIRLVFCNVIEAVEAELDRYELTDLFGEDAFYKSVKAVINEYDKSAADDKDRK